ncbi:small membrane A-kinase anchor protein isoform X1 [Parus major]|uniref:small membrane A-kinase anchor protein isoform X1 n=1 Tax=Parus major TaxID=9157 RepID=UPI0007715329|nr:small membrane A-kinase anchor protein isoform X1 [Parus major]
MRSGKSPRREAVSAVLGTRGRPVRSRRGSVVRNELTLAGNTLPGWQRDCLALVCPISSEEAQKEMFCSLKITGATGKKQRHCIEQGNHFQVIKTCC